MAMGLLDWILNLAGLLLWLNWLSVPTATPAQMAPLSLASTLKVAPPDRRARWSSLALLLLLLIIRALFYWNVGSATGWTPNLELGAISLPFRSDFIWRSFLFSLLSFLLLLATLYAWLLLLSVVNRRVPNQDPLQRLVRFHLGRLEHWPNAMKLLFPALLATLLWALAHPGLVRLGLVPAHTSQVRLWKQALLLGLSSFLAWKLLILAVCVLYLVNSYVYLGNSSFWNFINLTGANLLQPLRRLPLCFGKCDLTPFVGIGLVVFLSQVLAFWLPHLYQGLAP